MESTHPLRRWREKNRLTQWELGSKIGVTGSQISQVESGAKGCSLEAALRIERLTKGAVPVSALTKGGVAA